MEADAHNEEKNQAAIQLLAKNGYLLLLRYERSDWFINKNFFHIYQGLLPIELFPQTIENVDENLYGLPQLEKFRKEGSMYDSNVVHDFLSGNGTTS